MEKMKYSIDEIRRLINPRIVEWENKYDTNCYAYALGLDIPEYEILKNAYQVGTIGSNILGISFSEIEKLSFEQKLKIDLEVLKIEIKKVRRNTQTPLSTYRNLIWTIALLTDGDDFHFLRKNNNVWWHKMGYFENPTNIDDYENQILDVGKCRIFPYKLIGTYQLKMKL